MLLTEISNNAIETIIKKSYPALSIYMELTLGDMFKQRLFWQVRFIPQEDMREYPNVKLKDYMRLKILKEFHINRGHGPLRFLRGIVRIVCGDEINFFSNYTEDKHKENLIMFKHIVDYINNNQIEMSEDFNGLSFTELSKTIGREVRISNFLKQQAKTEKTKVSNKTYGEYSVVKINKYDDAARYSKFTSWCVTNDYTAYKNYTSDGSQFYFCLKNNFKKIKEEVGENCPLDEYGLSMVSVCVKPNGEAGFVTTRWNHDNNGENNPQLKTLEQVEEVLGIPSTVFVNTRITGKLNKDDIPTILENENIDIQDIFDSVKPIKSTDYIIVEYNGMFNIIRGRRLMLDKWCFRISQTFHYGILLVVNENRAFELYDVNLNRINTEPLSYARYMGGSPSCWYVTNLDGEVNYIDRKGKLFFEEWVKYASSFDKSGICLIKTKDDNYYYINKKKQVLFPNMVFQKANHFENGFATVCIDDTWYILKQNGETKPVVDNSGNGIFYVSWFTEGYACINYIDYDYGHDILTTEGDIIRYEDFKKTHSGFWLEDFVDEEEGDILTALQHGAAFGAR